MWGAGRGECVSIEDQFDRSLYKHTFLRSQLSRVIDSILGQELNRRSSTASVMARFPFGLFSSSTTLHKDGFK